MSLTDSASDRQSTLSPRPVSLRRGSSTRPIQSPMGPRLRQLSSTYALSADTALVTNITRNSSGSALSRDSTLYTTSLPSSPTASAAPPEQPDTKSLAEFTEPDPSAQPLPVSPSDERHDRLPSPAPVAEAPMMVKPVPKTVSLAAPPTLKFEPATVQWKSLPLEAALCE